MRVSSADWFGAGVALQRVGPTSLGIAPTPLFERRYRAHTPLPTLYTGARVDFGSSRQLHNSLSAWGGQPNSRQSEPKGEVPDL